ncbi:hypothetical protein D3C72_955490 [compost metagenome]
MGHDYPQPVAQQSETGETPPAYYGINAGLEDRPLRICGLQKSRRRYRGRHLPEWIWKTIEAECLCRSARADQHDVGGGQRRLRKSGRLADRIRQAHQHFPICRRARAEGQSLRTAACRLRPDEGQRRHQTLPSGQRTTSSDQGNCEGTSLRRHKSGDRRAQAVSARQGYRPI